MNVLFPLLAVLIWSINAVVSKVSATAIDPAAISFYRWALALIVLTLSCCRERSAIGQPFAPTGGN